jgi:hypothetical protein
MLVCSSDSLQSSISNMPTPSLILVPARFKSGKLYTPVATTSGALVLGASGDFNVTRDTTATRVNASGLIEGVASGIPRLDYFGSSCPALLVEPAATNLVLQSRSLNNAVWSGTTVTTVKDAVGANGTASGATTVTATAASGTVLQALAHASQSRVFSAYIRRVSGTGAIQLTTNGGTNWDTVTITSGYTLVASEARTVASGTVGIRLAASGDVIEVDYAQGEVGPVATSRIPTTIGSVTRNADSVSLSSVSGVIGQSEGTIYFEYYHNTASNAGIRNVFNLEGNVASVFNGINFATSNNGNDLQVAVQVSGSSVVSGGTFSTSVSEGWHKVAFGYNAATSGTSFYFDGNLIATRTLTSIPAMSRIAVLARSNPFSGFGLDRQFNNRIRAVALYTTRLTNQELAALTT